ncbi:ABC transporter permease subunit [Pectobacteriaceae bacterium CE70]|uniref:Molybdate ABC transporter permease subunit n=1 Tax=Serratia sp. (strain ATCC 39006) TaxID=104623 RepID=A0A2I5T4K0_SERS3|nr:MULTISPECIES: ABC transporter permease subunit [Enterobacterales]AUG99499.1 molybdate ABC transporter permease subunit [Serratia sp. ATCC 39006]AUH03817.1 molybdate ABC transporter permease subunit [Serratia sp. ATCC 39006]WJV66185.1 ABC transporter permease subunit [Pectobacteriaceae bacterium CE70]WJY10195.1 ABC transporter permease subunit [Pectobacteriaceae bacterium C80]
MSFLQTFWDTLLLPDVQFSLGLTLRVLAITLVLHLFAGLGLGYLLSRRSWPGQGLLDVVVTLPLVFPPIATGFALLLLLGRHGWVGQWLESMGQNVVFALPGVVIASFLAGLPLVVKPVEVAMRELSTRHGEVARTLGKGEIEIFLLVLLPNLRIPLATGLILGLGRALGEVGVTLMLGGNIVGKTNTLSLEIYNAVFSGDFSRASVLSSLLGVVSLLVFMVLRKLSFSRSL